MKPWCCSSTRERLPISPAETHIWVVTKNDFRWVRSELGTWQLITEVQALRCGLDAAAWRDEKLCPRRKSGLHRSRCEVLVRRAAAIRSRARLPPVPAIVRPSGGSPQRQAVAARSIGSADAIAFPGAGDRSAGRRRQGCGVVIRDHALTVLPAVSSLKALRRVARPSAAKSAMTGFGNPLLDGDPANAEDRERARTRPRPAALPGSGFAAHSCSCQSAARIGPIRPAAG